MVSLYHFLGNKKIRELISLLFFCLAFFLEKFFLYNFQRLTHIFICFLNLSLIIFLCRLPLKSFYGLFYFFYFRFCLCACFFFFQPYHLFEINGLKCRWVIARNKKDLLHTFVIVHSAFINL